MYDDEVLRSHLRYTMQLHIIRVERFNLCIQLRYSFVSGKHSRIAIIVTSNAQTHLLTFNLEYIS